MSVGVTGHLRSANCLILSQYSNAIFSTSVQSSLLKGSVKKIPAICLFHAQNKCCERLDFVALSQLRL